MKVKLLNYKMLLKLIKEHCRNKLASFKVPGKVIFLNELSNVMPRSVTGKIQKNKLREIVIAFLSNSKHQLLESEQT